MRTLRVALVLLVLVATFSGAPTAEAQGCACTGGCYLHDRCFYCDFCIFCCSVCTVQGCRYCQQEPCTTSAQTSVSARPAGADDGLSPCSASRIPIPVPASFGVVRVEDASART